MTIEKFEQKAIDFCIKALPIASTERVADIIGSTRAKVHRLRAKLIKAGIIFIHKPILGKEQLEQLYEHGKILQMLQNLHVNRKNQPITTQDIQFIQDKLGDESIDAIAAQMGRTVYSVQKIISAHNLRYIEESGYLCVKDLQRHLKLTKAMVFHGVKTGILRRVPGTGCDKRELDFDLGKLRYKLHDGFRREKTVDLNRIFSCFANNRCHAVLFTPEAVQAFIKQAYPERDFKCLKCPKQVKGAAYCHFCTDALDVDLMVDAEIFVEEAVQKREETRLAKAEERKTKRASRRKKSGRKKLRHA